MMPHPQNRLVTVLDDFLEAIRNQEKTVEECLALNPSYQSELAPLLHLAARLQAAHSLTPEAEFRTALLGRLRTQLRPRSTTNFHFRRLKHSGTSLPARRLSLSPLMVGLLLAIFLVVSSRVWFVSAKALPGDSFYPLKMYAERIQLAVTPGEASRASLHLDFANRRLRESEALQEQNRGALIGQTINDYTALMDEESSLLDAKSSLPLPDQIDLANRLLVNLPRHQSVLVNLLEMAAPKDREPIQNAYVMAQKVLQRAGDLAGSQPGEVTPSLVPNPTSTPTPPPITASPTLQPNTPTRSPQNTVTAPASGSLPTRTALPPLFSRTPPPKTQPRCAPGSVSSNNALPTCRPTKTTIPTRRPNVQPGSNNTATLRSTKPATQTPKANFPPIATLRATRTQHPTIPPGPWSTP